MSSERKVITLDDAGVALLDCVHKTPEEDPEGSFRYVAIPQMSNGRIRIDESRRISSSDFDEWTKKAAPQSHDVVLSRRCNPGETAYVAPGERFALGQNLVLLRADGVSIFPPFLRWLVRGPAWWEQIQKNLNVGAVFDSLKCRDVPSFELPVPSLDEQRTIAGVLGALDDKIEQNRCTAQTLEKLARAIFRAWFVDFEPVKAKAAGATSFPSMPQAVFDALPIRFVNSTVGLVPDGWEVKAIGDVVTVKGGATPRTREAEFWDDGTHCWATPKDMSRLAHPVLLDTERRITDAGVESISSGVLPVGTVLMSSRAPVGYLAIAGVPTAINQGFIAMVCDGPLPPIFVLNWAMNSMDTIKAHASGTTFPEISKKTFRPLPIINPDAQCVSAYQHITDPLFGLLVASIKESGRLAEVRDYLLPQLLSGDVRVSHG
ncbi:MAG TPA: restriction endonuclease subunit S [Rhodanobacteraceae bacterium]|nr:restriction endonuclease subunit S [Rhodanobacteraceae bacterium]